MAITRRKFFGNMAVLGAGAGIDEKFTSNAFVNQEESCLPREVWIATTSLDDLEAVAYDQASDRMLEILKETLSFNPDIICLPETFPTSAIEGKASSMEKEAAEYTTGEYFEKFSNFARTNSCYIILPIHTNENGRLYNSAVLIDRKGVIQGDYKKIHPTKSEIAIGISPGPIDPPVFKTDFGTIGMQICFDIHWREGCQKLRGKGAEIIFWPSAFGGGEMINTMAWQNRSVVVSSTIKGTSKICDINGKTINKTGFWNKNWTCGPVNLEKVFLHLYPYIRQVPAIQKKYGRNVNIEAYHEEEWLIIESLSKDLKVSTIMEEFELKTYEEHIGSADSEQNKSRP